MGLGVARSMVLKSDIRMPTFHNLPNGLLKALCDLQPYCVCILFHFRPAESTVFYHS